MPIIQPIVTDTQSSKERDSLQSLKAYGEISHYEIYWGVAEIQGNGTFNANGAGFYSLTQGQVARFNFPKPEYWWNGEVKWHIWWCPSGALTGTMSVETTISTFRAGSATATTVLVSDIGTNAARYTGDGTAYKLFHQELSTEDEAGSAPNETAFEDIVQEDEIIRVKLERLTDGVGQSFGIVSAQLEYYPRIQQ